MPRRISFLLLLASLLQVACGGGHTGNTTPPPPPADDSLQHFSDPEEWAKIFDDPERDAWQHPDEVVGLLAISPGMTVADIGSGTGYFLRRLSKAVGDQGVVIGTDIEPNMVTYMKGRASREALANVQAVLAAPDDPTLPAASIDRILACDVWHHISEDTAARTAYGRKLVATLRPGGAVMIVDYDPDSPDGPPSKHRVPAAFVVAELTAAGLKAEILDEQLPQQYVVVGRLP